MQLPQLQWVLNPLCQVRDQTCVLALQRCCQSCCTTVGTPGVLLNNHSHPKSHEASGWDGRNLKAERKDVLQYSEGLEPTPFSQCVFLWTRDCRYLGNIMKISNFTRTLWLEQEKGKQMCQDFPLSNKFVELVIHSFTSFKIQNVYKGIQ